VRTYGLPVSAQAAAYIGHVIEHPAMQAWISDALAEQDYLAEDEPYRTQR